MNWDQCEKILQYSFRNRALLCTALRHTSYVNEHGGESSVLQSNQRLEFLGDSVLGLVVSTYIYQNCPGFPEGKLSRLRAAIVCEESLAAIAMRLSFPSFLQLGVGERQSNGAQKASILADAFESMIGAVYLDSDFSEAERFLLCHIEGDIMNGLRSYDLKDYKTNLQEKIGKEHLNPVYQIISTNGPAHDCIYTARVTVGDITAEGEGRSKKDAQQKAAKEMLEKMNEEKPVLFQA